MINRTREIRNKYAKLEKEKYGKEWTKEQVMKGFVGDVGDLMKLIMAKQGVRDYDNIDKKLAHELSDYLWSIIILADKYNIDLEKSFLETMNLPIPAACCGEDVIIEKDIRALARKKVLYSIMQQYKLISKKD